MAHAAGDAHEYPVYGAHCLLTFPILDAAGDLVTGAAGLDSEVSKDLGTMTDCTNEATQIATSSGTYYLYLTGAEMTASVVTVIVKTSTSGAKTTVLTLYPKRLPVLESGTAQAGASTTITLASGASAVDDFYNGLFVLITNDSPAGAQYQLRKVVDYVGSTRVATIESAWGTNPSSASTYDILVPETANVAAWAGTKVHEPSRAGVPMVVGTNSFYGASGTGTTLTIPATATWRSSATDAYLDAMLVAVSGPGAGQGRRITAYNGTTKVLTWLENWTDWNSTTQFVLMPFNADGFDVNVSSMNASVIAASTFIVGAIDASVVATDIVNEIRDTTTAAVWTYGTRSLTTNPGLSELESLVLHSGTAQAGASQSITLATGASSTNDLYVGCLVKIYDGTGEGQVRTITSYDGGTKAATVDRVWQTQPTSSSLYAVMIGDGPAVGTDLVPASDTSPVVASTDLTLYRSGFDYLNAHNNAIAFSDTLGTWPTSMAAPDTVTLVLETGTGTNLSIAGTIVDANNVRFDVNESTITAAVSESITVRFYVYVTFNADSKKVILTAGSLRWRLPTES